MLRRPPRSTLTDTLFPYTTLFRSDHLRRLLEDQRARRQAVEQKGAHEDGGLEIAGNTQAKQRDEVGAADGVVARLGASDALDRTLAEQLGPLRQAPRGVRSEERRVGKECVSTCRSRWSPCL